MGFSVKGLGMGMGLLNLRNEVSVSISRSNRETEDEALLYDTISTKEHAQSFPSLFSSTRHWSTKLSLSLSLSLSLYPSVIHEVRSVSVFAFCTPFSALRFAFTLVV